MDKVLKIVKLLSLILFLVTLLTVYANLPKITSLFVNELEMTKETFFYSTLIIFSLVNLLFAILKNIFSKVKAGTDKKEKVRSWFLSLPVMFNFYLIFMIAYIGIINNTSSIDPSGYFYLIYLGPVLVLIWTAAFFKIQLEKENSLG